MCNLSSNCRELHTLFDDITPPQTNMVVTPTVIHLGMRYKRYISGGLFLELETQEYILTGNVFGYGMELYGVFARLGRGATS